MDRFKLMETYAAVVRSGSYTRAASELGVTRAMVSRRIQDLESNLGARLLNRNTHGVAVTGIPVGATGEIMVDEVNSLYVDAGRDWITAVGALIENEILRKEIATTGLAQFTRHHTTDHLWPRLLELLTG